MSNQPWKTDNWFVSPWNFDPAVRKEIHFQKREIASTWHYASRRRAANRRDLHQGR